MGNHSKVRYKLPWPGLGSIPLYIIDNFDVVFSAENRLPPRLRHLNVLRHQYIKLYTILDLIDDTMGRVNANVVLNQLITDYGLRSMRTIACYKASPFGQQVVVDQYLPLSTLLALLIVYPSKTFDKFRYSLFEYLECNRDLPCMDCGFVRRNCKCDASDCPVDESEDVAVGYATSYADQGIQTDESSKITKLQTVSLPQTVPVIPEEQGKVMTGPGGMKVVLPPSLKLDHGIRIPLTMSHNSAGPCLVPASTSMPPMIAPNMFMPPADNLMNQQPIYPSLLPNPHNLPPYNMDPSALMPPPMFIPPLPGSMSPGAGPFINKTTAKPTSHGQSMKVSGKATGPPIGHIDVRIPEGCNPRYINTIVGTYKRILPLRNVAIQVDTVVLPKKKSKIDVAVTHIYSGGKGNSNGRGVNDLKTKTLFAKNTNSIVGDTKVLDLTVEGTDGNKPHTSADLKNPDDITMADLDEATAKIMDEDTLEMLKRMEKYDNINKMVTAAPPATKKVDKVWRIIDDDSDEEVDKPGSETALAEEKVDKPGSETALAEENVDKPGSETALAEENVDKPGSETALTEEKVDKPGSEMAPVEEKVHPVSVAEPKEEHNESPDINADKQENKSSDELVENKVETPLSKIPAEVTGGLSPSTSTTGAADKACDQNMEDALTSSPVAMDTSSSFVEGTNENSKTSGPLEDMSGVERAKLEKKPAPEGDRNQLSSKQIDVESKVNAHNVDSKTETSPAKVAGTDEEPSLAPDKEHDITVDDIDLEVAKVMTQSLANVDKPAVLTESPKPLLDSRPSEDSEKNVLQKSAPTGTVCEAYTLPNNPSAPCEVGTNGPSTGDSTQERTPPPNDARLTANIIDIDLSLRSTSDNENEDEVNSADGKETRPSSANDLRDDLQNCEDEEAKRRSLAAEVLGSLASFAPLVPAPVTDSQQATGTDVRTESPSGSPLQSAAPTSPQKRNSPVKSENSADVKPSRDKVSEVPENNNDDIIEDKLVIDEGKDEKEESDNLVKTEETDEVSDVTDIFPSSPPPMVTTVNKDGQKKYFAKFEHLPTGEKLYRCTFPTCSQCFDTRGAAKLHNQSHTVEETIRRLYCAQCDYKVPFYMWFDLLRHLRETHSTGLTEDANGCMFCGLVFETSEKLVRHMEFHYSSRYKCVHCGIMVVSWGQVKLHMESCPEKEQKKVNFGCPYCMFVFHKRTIRNIHMLSHSDRGLSCALCDDETAHWEHWKLLRKHYQSRHAKVLTAKVGPFRNKLPMKKRNPKCHICSSEFKVNDLYHNHMIKVHDLLPYTLLGCSMCDKTFRTRRRLDWHTKNAHEEEVTCEECDFVARNKTILRMHTTQKHSEKQHLCTECGKSFVYFHQLRVHMAHHARRIVHTCRTCAQEFTRSAELRKHVHEEHSMPGEKKAHYCTECEYWTYTRATLVSHIQKKHSGMDNDEDSDGPSAPAELPAGSNHSTMYPQASPPYPRVNRPITTPDNKRGDSGNKRKTKKRKRLTMQPRRQSISRSSKNSEATVIKPAWDKEEAMAHLKPVRDRSERKRLRLEEEEHKKVKKLKRTSCARTRSVDEQKAMQDDVEIENHEGMTIPAKMQTLPGFQMPNYNKRQRSVSGEELPGMHFSYPYIDHNYYKLEEQADFVMPRYPASGSRKRSRQDSFDYSSSQDESSSMDIVHTPSVSGFETCETSPTELGGGYKRKYSRAKCSPGFSRAVRPGGSGDDLPLTSTSYTPHNPKIQSPVQIRSLLSKALQASPTKTNRGKVSSLSQQLRTLAMDPLEMKDLDFSELINEAGEILPEQDLITDILNSLDSFNLPVVPSDGSPKFGEVPFGTSPGGSKHQQSAVSQPLPEPPLFEQDLILSPPSSSPQIENVGNAVIGEHNLKTQTLKIPTEPQKTRGPTSTVDSSFDDTILEVAPVGVINDKATDLDEIELKEADYQLWHDSPQPPESEEPLTEFDNSLENAQIIIEFKDDEIKPADQTHEGLAPDSQELPVNEEVKVREPSVDSAQKADQVIVTLENSEDMCESMTDLSSSVQGPSHVKQVHHTGRPVESLQGPSHAKQERTTGRPVENRAWLIDHQYFGSL